MNRKNIQKVRDVIAGLPAKRFAMEKWSGLIDGYGFDVEPERLLHDCKTCGCIGGWTEAVFPKFKGRAIVALGLDRSRSDALFLPCGIDWEGVTRAHAVRVLDHLLETGEVDWKSTRRAKKAGAK